VLYRLTGSGFNLARAVVGQLAKVEGELRKLTDALAAGAAVASVLDAIKARESAKRDLQAKLEHLDGISKAAEHQAWTLEQLREIAQNWNSFLHLAPAIGRQYLQRIVTGPVTVHKTATGWSFAFAGFLGALLEGVIKYVYAPRGHMQRTCGPCPLTTTAGASGPARVVPNLMLCWRRRGVRGTGHPDPAHPAPTASPVRTSRARV
jgi:hypothetical protein